MPSELTIIGASSSGRTSRFEREKPGSNPGAPANLECAVMNHHIFEIRRAAGRVHALFAPARFLNSQNFLLQMPR